MKKLLAAVAFLALTACNQGADTNQVMAEANASGAEANARVENAIIQSAATPLQKEQALALIKERHANYEKIGKAMRAAKKGIDGNDPAAVKQAAATVNELAPQAATWFPAGSGPEAGKTHAREEIWQKPEDFDRKMADFRQAAARFAQVASTGDMAQSKAAHADLGRTCKSCHDEFKRPD